MPTDAASLGHAAPTDGSAVVAPAAPPCVVASAPLPAAATAGSMPACPTVKRAIMWFRRDLRVADNPALLAALHMAEEVVPVFVWAPEEQGQFQPGRCSRWWLQRSLASLEADLAALGSRLRYVRAPESATALLTLAREAGAQALMFNHLYDPISMVHDNEVKAALAGAGIACVSFNGDVLREPWAVVDAVGKPLTRFDDFWAAHTAAARAAGAPAPAATPSLRCHRPAVGRPSAARMPRAPKSGQLGRPPRPWAARVALVARAAAAPTAAPTACWTWRWMSARAGSSASRPPGAPTRRPQATRTTTSAPSADSVSLRGDPPPPTWTPTHPQYM